MRKNTFTPVFAVGLFFSMCFTNVWAEHLTEPDNTAKNRRDQNGGNLTALDQSQHPKDIQVTRQLRRSILSNRSLSMNAKNIKIITRDGVVTVRGPVDSWMEKEAIHNFIKNKVPDFRIEDQLEVTLNNAAHV